MTYLRFASLLKRVKEVSFEVIVSESPGSYASNGEWIPPEVSTRMSRGVILPLSGDDLRRQDNGQYTYQDRKIITTDEYDEGAIVIYKGTRYIVNRSKDYSDYSDSSIYFARGPKNP